MYKLAQCMDWRNVRLTKSKVTKSIRSHTLKILISKYHNVKNALFNENGVDMSWSVLYDMYRAGQRNEN